jgi:hypothetical protein
MFENNCLKLNKQSKSSIDTVSRVSDTKIDGHCYENRRNENQTQVWPCQNIMGNISVCIQYEELCCSSDFK